jgi:NAD(P)H-dependent FMN reductase
MNTTPCTIAVIAGSTREGRFSDQAAAWVATELGKTSGVTTDVIDLRDYNMPFFNESVSPSSKSAPYTNEAVARFTKKIESADAFVIVTPEYNHSTSAVLKNAMDWVYQEWNHKPVAFVSYGSVGGARAVEHLRLVAVELQMAPIRNAVHIPGDKYFGMRGGATTPVELFASLQKPLDGMIEQLLWWAQALKTARG